VRLRSHSEATETKAAWMMFRRLATERWRATTAPEPAQSRPAGFGCAGLDAQASYRVSVWPAGEDPISTPIQDPGR